MLVVLPYHDGYVRHVLFPPLLEIGAHPDFVLILIEHTTDWGHLVQRKAEDG